MLADPINSRSFVADLDAWYNARPAALQSSLAKLALTLDEYARANGLSVN